MANTVEDTQKAAYTMGHVAREMPIEVMSVVSKGSFALSMVFRFASVMAAGLILLILGISSYHWLYGSDIQPRDVFFFAFSHPIISAGLFFFMLPYLYRIVYRLRDVDENDD